MMACSFGKLLKLLDKQLDLDGQIDVLLHLDECDTCRDAVYQIALDRDEALLTRRPYSVEKNVA